MYVYICVICVILHVYTYTAVYIYNHIYIYSHMFLKMYSTRKQTGLKFATRHSWTGILFPCFHMVSSGKTRQRQAKLLWQGNVEIQPWHWGWGQRWRGSESLQLGKTMSRCDHLSLWKQDRVLAVMTTPFLDLREHNPRNLSRYPKQRLKLRDFPRQDARSVELHLPARLYPPGWKRITGDHTPKNTLRNHLQWISDEFQYSSTSELHSNSNPDVNISSTAAGSY